jgi:predicted phage terminase large subunit-like protein
MPTLTPQEQARLEFEALQHRARTDKLYLADLLGYDFQPDVHGELFDTYIKFDRSKPYFEQDRQKHRLILWSRAFYKTTSTIVEMVQTILNFPDVSIMIMQSTEGKAKELLAQVKGHFDGTNLNSKLSTLFPEFCKEKLGTAMAFTVPTRQRARKDPTVFVASPRSSKAGLHPDVGFFDDLVTEQNYTNPDQLKKTIEQFSHYTPLVNNGGYFYVTGTRYTFGDLYEHIIRGNEPTAEFPKGKWKVTIKGCWQEDANGNRISDSNFPPRKLTRGSRAGETIGISLAELLAIQRENPETFAAQYLNRPIAAGTQLFTESLLLGAVVPRDNPNEPPVSEAWQGPAFLFVDLAESRDPRADKRVIVCGRQRGGVPTVCDIRSGQWSTLQIAQNILEMSVLHRPLRVLIEGSQGSTFFTDYLVMIAKDKGISLPVEKIKVSNNKGAKYLRIAAIEGAIKQGRLRFLAALPGWADLVQQFVEFPKGKHDDEIDTISLMLQFYSGQLALTNTAPTANLPFFLRTPGVDYGLETQIVNPQDAEALAFCPEPIF